MAQRVRLDSEKTGAVSRPERERYARYSYLIFDWASSSSAMVR